MARSRLDKTLADYVVIAISPALIMTLVGSLAFFLLEVSYRGQYPDRIRWVLFCFVFGAVLVARIAIEHGREHAHLFGLALGAATGFFMFRFVDAVLVAWTLLAVIWWCSWKLTWDCTLIDDSEDASGEGLLQAAGLDERATAEASPPTPPDQAEGKRPHKKPKPTGGFYGEGALVDPHEIPLDGGAEAGTSNAPVKKPHAPGQWIVYFSLAALPLFGVGQLFIPATDTARRWYAFIFLAVYVASALGLLLTTSFLGLRRYLRQRKLRMPVAMTGAWLGMGTGLAVLLLLLALLIPRPQGEYTLTALVDKLDQKARDASKFAMLGGDRGEGEGRRIGKQDQEAGKPGEGDAQKPDEQKADEGQPPNGDQQGQGKQGQPGSKQGNADGGKGEGQGKGEGKQGGQKQGDDAKGGGDQKNDQGKPKPGEQRAGDQKPPNQEQQAARPDGNPPQGAPPPGNPASSLLSQLGPLAKWLIYGLLAAAGVYLLIRHWARFVAVLAQLWAELMNLWNSLFGIKPKSTSEAAEGEEAPVLRRRRPFASFENPFFSGADRRLTPAQLALYTFEALEAWSREQAIERPPEQTPLEFAQELGRRVPALAKDVQQTAQLYAHVVYAKRSPTKESLPILERMWGRMQTMGREGRESTG